MCEDYVIEIFANCGEYGYYWCILKIGDDDERSNAGFGYASSRKKAFEDACDYYDKVIKN